MEDGSSHEGRGEQLVGCAPTKFIQEQKHAARSKNKTYGICRVTNKLIPKERLRLVPHATLSIEAKQRHDDFHSHPSRLAGLGACLGG